MSAKNKHDKKPNVVNRTTSETLRLGGDSDLRVLSQTTLRQDAPALRKKIQNSSSSFQITGVSVTRSDFGDDSADDLDESHTDDISRVTDNETPSFSEDSRDIDDHPLYDNSAPSTILVLPEPLVELKPSRPPEEDAGARFKVVKIPNVAPFNRGRWTCYDYLDNAGLNPNYICPKPKYTPSLATKPVDPTKLNPQDISISPYEGAAAGDGPSPSDSIEQAIHLVGAQGELQQQKSGGKKDDILLSNIKVALRSKPSSNSESSPNNNNIDRKIEEALDAVKTHLMVAVHKEVDFLKTRVSTLEGRVNELEIENSILRVNYLLFKS